MIGLTKDKPNGVLFKTDKEELVISLIKNKEFDWENLMVLNKDKMKDEFNDLSSDPFEFVFINYQGDKITTSDKKSIVDNYTFSKLFDENKLFNTVKTDYEKQYGSI